MGTSAEHVEPIVGEAARFVDSEFVEFTYSAPIINLKCETKQESLSFLENVDIRRITDEQATELFGGSLYTLRPNPLVQPNYMFEGRLVERKLLGASHGTDDGQNYTALEETLTQAVLALRTFKQGPVGIAPVHFSPVAFTPFVTGPTSRRSTSEYIPQGTYEIAAGDVPMLTNHAAKVCQPLHKTLEIACSRLASASVRLGAGDRLIDAVIGLEAILLHQLADPQYRGEIRFRFALNYSALADRSADRQRRYTLAKSLYDLRSRLVHGSEVNSEAIKVGSDTMGLKQAADLACDILRQVLDRFLPGGVKPPYSELGYWEKQYFQTASTE